MEKREKSGYQGEHSHTFLHCGIELMILADILIPFMFL